MFRRALLYFKLYSLCFEMGLLLLVDQLFSDLFTFPDLLTNRLQKCSAKSLEKTASKHHNWDKP